MDVSKAFYSKDMKNERNRLIQKYLSDNHGDGNVLCDCFCRIGSLSVKAAVKVRGLRVVCNDENPDAIKYCNANALTNKVENRVHTMCMDAKKFIKFYV